MKNQKQSNWLSTFLTGLFVIFSLTAFGQGITLQEFQGGGQSHQGAGHNEKCGHVFLEQKQEKELGVFGSKPFFEDWINKKIVEKNSKPQIAKVQAAPRIIPVVVHIIHNGTEGSEEHTLIAALLTEKIESGSE